MKRSNRLLWCGYATLLRSLHDQPATAPEIAQRLGIHENTARRLLRRLKDLDIIHRKEWVRLGPRSPHTPVWALGAGPEAPRPLCLRTGEPSQHPALKIGRAKPQAELVTFAALMKALLEPHSFTSLSQACGVHYNHARKFIKHTQALKLTHISHWERRMHGGTPTAFYQFGIDKPDARRPAREPRREIERRYQQARRAKLRMQRITFALAGNTANFNLAA